MSWFPVFDPSYEVVLADTDTARRIHFRLRYRVYCLEEGLEEANAYPDGEEKDEYDANAVHFLVRFKPTGEWIAALRLLLPGHRGLPIAAHARLDSAYLQVLGGGQCRVAEVSRLCIIETFRVGKANGRMADQEKVRHRGVDRSPWQRCQRQILLGLLRAIYEWCDRRGIDQLLFLISPALGRVLSRINVSFEVIGEPCRYRGLRYPCSARLADAAPVLMRNYPNRGRRGARAARAYRRFSEIDAPPIADLPIANTLDTCRV